MLGFMAVEDVDADAAAIGVALVAMRLAARPAKGSFTYGLRRAEILSAQANGLTLLLLAIFFIVESIRWLFSPAAADLYAFIGNAIAAGVILLTG